MSRRVFFRDSEAQGFSTYGLLLDTLFRQLKAVGVAGYFPYEYQEDMRCGYAELVSFFGEEFGRLAEQEGDTSNLSILSKHASLRGLLLEKYRKDNERYLAARNSLSIKSLKKAEEVNEPSWDKLYASAEAEDARREEGIRDSGEGKPDSAVVNSFLAAINGAHAVDDSSAPVYVEDDEEPVGGYFSDEDEEYPSELPDDDEEDEEYNEDSLELPDDDEEDSSELPEDDDEEYSSELPDDDDEYSSELPDDDEYSSELPDDDEYSSELPDDDEYDEDSSELPEDDDEDYSELPDDEEDGEDGLSELPDDDDDEGYSSELPEDDDEEDSSELPDDDEYDDEDSSELPDDDEYDEEDSSELPDDDDEYDEDSSELPDDDDDEYDEDFSELPADDDDEYDEEDSSELPDDDDEDSSELPANGKAGYSPKLSAERVVPNPRVYVAPVVSNMVVRPSYARGIPGRETQEAMLDMMDRLANNIKGWFSRL